MQVNFADYCATMNDKIKDAIIQAYNNGGGLIFKPLQNLFSCVFAAWKKALKNIAAA